MEGYHDGDGDDGHVDGEAEPGEECALVGEVVAGVGGVVGKEEGGDERGKEEGVGGGGGVGFAGVKGVERMAEEVGGGHLWWMGIMMLWIGEIVGLRSGFDGCKAFLVGPLGLPLWRGRRRLPRIRGTAWGVGPSASAS